MTDKAGPSKAPEQDKMTLAEYLSLPENQNANIVMPLSWCPHLEEVNDEFKVKDFDVKKKCEFCENEGENWICLTCHKVYCSRYVNQHMLNHSQATLHAIALSFSDLSCWCFHCDDYISNDKLYDLENALHRNKFNGEVMPRKSNNSDNLVLEMG